MPRIMNNNALIISALLVFTLAIAGCGGGDSGEEATNDVPVSYSALKLSSVIMPTGAQGAIVTGSSTSTKPAVLTGVTTSTDDPITLNPDAMYMVNESGILEEVDYADEDGNSLKNVITPTKVLEINAKWLFMEFLAPAPSGGVVSSYQYLVEKSTGRAFYLPSAEPCYTYDELSGDQLEYACAAISLSGLDSSQIVTHHFKTAANGDIFALFSTPGDVYRIAVSEMTDRTIVATQVNTVEPIEQFDITSDGSLLVYTGRDATYASVMRAIRVADGALTSIAPIYSQLGVTYLGKPAFIRGLNGHVYSAVDGNFVEFSLDDLGQVQASLIPLINLENPLWWPYHNFAYSRHVVAGKLIIICDSCYGGFIELNSTGNSVVPTPIPISNPDRVLATRDYLFVFGTNDNTQIDEIYRIDPSTYTAVNLPVSTEYDIYDMAVLTTETVWFKALRLADGATVIGEVDISGNVTIKDVLVATEPQVLTLTPIHPSNFIVIDGDTWDWSEDYLQLTDGLSDSIGNGASDMVDIYATSDGFTLYFAVSVNGSLDTLQDQDDIAANSTATFTPEVQLKLGLTPNYSVRLGPSGIFIFDEMLYTSTAVGLGVIGDKVFEGKIPLSSIGSPTSVTLDGAIGWASEDATLFTSYDTATSISLPIP